MGLLIKGVWQDIWYDTDKTGGTFERKAASFRNWLTPDGAAGSGGEGGFKAASGRYHLYAILACPWAHRTLIFRKLKGLEEHIDVSVVHPDMLGADWTLGTVFAGATVDSHYGLPFVRDLYLRADPTCITRVTVPILWDKSRETIVPNESAKIIRMFNSAFEGVTGNTADYWPDGLRAAIAPVTAGI